MGKKFLGEKKSIIKRFGASERKMIQRPKAIGKKSVWNEVVNLRRESHQEMHALENFVCSSVENTRIQDLTMTE